MSSPSPAALEVTHEVTVALEALQKAWRLAKKCPDPQVYALRHVLAHLVLEMEEVRPSLLHDVHASPASVTAPRASHPPSVSSDAVRDSASLSPSATQIQQASSLPAREQASPRRSEAPPSSVVSSGEHHYATSSSQEAPPSPRPSSVSEKTVPSVKETEVWFEKFINAPRGQHALAWWDTMTKKSPSQTLSMLETMSSVELDGELKRLESALGALEPDERSPYPVSLWCAHLFPILGRSVLPDVTLFFQKWPHGRQEKMLHPETWVKHPSFWSTLRAGEEPVVSLLLQRTTQILDTTAWSEQNWSLLLKNLIEHCKPGSSNWNQRLGWWHGLGGKNTLRMTSEEEAQPPTDMMAPYHETTVEDYLTQRLASLKTSHQNHGKRSSTYSPPSQARSTPRRQPGR